MEAHMHDKKILLGAENEYVNVNQAADYFGVSSDNVRDLIAEGILPAYRMGKRLIRIRISDLEKVFHLIPSAATK